MERRQLPARKFEAQDFPSQKISFLHAILGTLSGLQFLPNTGTVYVGVSQSQGVPQSLRTPSPQDLDFAESAQRKYVQITVRYCCWSWCQGYAAGAVSSIEHLLTSRKMRLAHPKTDPAKMLVCILHPAIEARLLDWSSREC